MDAPFHEVLPAPGGRRYALERPKTKDLYDSSAISSFFSVSPTVSPETPAMWSAAT